MIGDFNIDGGVVGEQAHFIGVNFVLVFSRQLCSKNGAILPRAGNEDYRPGKGVKDMLAFYSDKLLSNLLHKTSFTLLIIKSMTSTTGHIAI